MRVDPLFVAVTAWFVEEYRAESERLAETIWATQTAVETALDQRAKRLEPILEEFFRRGQTATNKVVDQEVAALSDQFQVPWKYNRDVIDEIQDVSIFDGYYDRKYQGVFTRREIDNLKKTILRAKYNNWAEDELMRAIQNTIRVTGNRARLLARTETQRLHETTQMVYYRQQEVQQRYKRVWYALPDARPSHRRMDGKVAGTDGYFTSPDVGKVIGPGSGPKDFAIGCRCRTELVKR